MSTARALVLIVMSVVLSSSGQTVLKLGLNEFTDAQKETAGTFVRTAIFSWQVWAGLGLFALSVLLWMRVLASHDLSWGYPLLGLSYVFVALAGWLVFGEQFGLGRIVGIVLIIAGAALIARS